MAPGRFQYVALDGTLVSASDWDDLPERMDRIVAFIPDCPQAPHTPEEHALIESFIPKLMEMMERCQRLPE